MLLKTKEKCRKLLFLHPVRNIILSLALIVFLLTAIVDFILFNSIYFMHCLYILLGIILTFLGYILLKTYNLISTIKAIGNCDYCKKIIYSGETCIQLNTGKKKALTLEYCNVSCYNNCVNKYPFVGEFNFINKKQTDNDIISFSDIIKYCYFMMILWFSQGFKLLEACDLLKYLIEINEKENKSLYEKFILYNCEICDII